MASLPTKLPQWYTVDEEKGKGWTPETTDIINNKENNEVIAAWNGTVYPDINKNCSVQINNLKIISPIQVGGGSLPEGMILPAQIGGVPVIPGSSLKGAFLNYLLSQWSNFSTEELEFFSTLIDHQKRCWYPKIIRVENILLKNLKAYPLNPQQEWQVFDNKNKLSIQWQVAPKHPPSDSCDKFPLQITLKTSPTEPQKRFLETRLLELLEKQGIGKGSASGFGRLATKIPSGEWIIRLKGMKPGVQPHQPKDKQRGEYRWTPQVLRANIRSYFTRLALSILTESDAKTLTNKIFGGLNYARSPLTLTSYLTSPIQQPRMGDLSGEYSNCNARDVHSTWIINVDCSEPFKPLIGDLLTLSSRLGGLGPGWRRPPHSMSKNVFRGSEFTVSPSNLEESFSILIERILNKIKELAITTKIVANLNDFKPSKRNGSILSIWKGKSEDWRKIVHGICSSQTPKRERPSWCGDTTSRPSGYAVREYKDEKYFLITVFDADVEATLSELEYQQIYQTYS